MHCSTAAFWISIALPVVFVASVRTAFGVRVESGCVLPATTKEEIRQPFKLPQTGATLRLSSNPWISSATADPCVDLPSGDLHVTILAAGMEGQVYTIGESSKWVIKMPMTVHDELGLEDEKQTTDALKVSGIAAPDTHLCYAHYDMLDGGENQFKSKCGQVLVKQFLSGWQLDEIIQTISVSTGEGGCLGSFDAVGRKIQFKSDKYNEVAALQPRPHVFWGSRRAALYETVTAALKDLHCKLARALVAGLYFSDLGSTNLMWASATKYGKHQLWAVDTKVSNVKRDIQLEWANEVPKMWMMEFGITCPRGSHRGAWQGFWPHENLVDQLAECDVF